MVDLWEAVTAEELRVGDHAALHALADARGRAVLAYCQSMCPPGRAVAAAADAFTLFRMAVIGSQRPHELEPEALLLQCTRRAAAKRLGSADRIARRSTLDPRPSVRRLPALLDSRAEARIECEDKHGPGMHLLCIRCRESERLQAMAEAAYHDAPPIAPGGEAARAIQRGLQQAGRSRKRHPQALPRAGRARPALGRPQAVQTGAGREPSAQPPRAERSRHGRPVVRPKILTVASAPPAPEDTPTRPAPSARARRPVGADVRSRRLALAGALLAAALAAVAVITAGASNSPNANAARAGAPAASTLDYAPTVIPTRSRAAAPGGSLEPLIPAASAHLAHEVSAPTTAPAPVADLPAPRHHTHRAARRAGRHASPRPRTPDKPPHPQPATPRPGPAPRVPPPANPSPATQPVIRVSPPPTAKAPATRVPAAPSRGQPEITVPDIKPAPASGGQPVIHVAPPPSG